MKHLIALCAIALSHSFLFGQFPIHEIIVDDSPGPYQFFGTDIVCGEGLAAFSYNYSSFDAKLSFFELDSSMSYEFQVSFEWDYMPYPMGLLARDSIVLFKAKYLSSVWGDRYRYIHHFSKNLGEWSYVQVDLDNLLGGGAANITSIVPTSHGTFVQSTRNLCGYNQTEWYQIFDLGGANATFNGPFCNVFSPGTRIHAADDRVFMTNSSDVIQELIFDADENFIFSTFYTHDYGQYQTGNWNDVFLIDSLVFSVMDSYDDFYQGDTGVSTLLLNSYAEVSGEMTVVETFNLSILYPELNLVSSGGVTVGDSGHILFHSQNLLFRYTGEELLFLGSINEYGESSSENATLNDDHMFLGQPTASNAGVNSGSVAVFTLQDEIITYGCMDSLACNFILADYPADICEYPAIYNCDGTCMNDLDSDGICDEYDDECDDFIDGYNAGFQAGSSSVGPSLCGPGTFYEATVGICLPDPSCIGDVNEDGIRGTADLLIFLLYFGEFCAE